MEFIGITIFRQLGKYPDQLTEHEPSAESAYATGLRAPNQPSPAEIQKHELTHVPYASWCKACVHGKGKIARHQVTTSNRPVIQIDFTFPQFEKMGKVTILSSIDTLRGMCSAVLLPSKHTSQYAQAELKAFIMDSGRSGHLILQSDNETSIVALAKSITNDMINVKLRQAPAYSSGSSGAVERFHQSLQAQIRTTI